MPTNTAPLTVYKASAGSGKTFTLAVEYIRLLVADPMNYCYTLAVTFTNKATQEMKLRILSKLYGIANSLPDADDYYKKVKKSFPNLTERVIRNRAGDALSLLVHDYSRFRVETIDSFFQRVLRNLARERGLTARLKVMLNAPKAVTLDVGYAFFIKINVSVFLTDADIFVRKAVFFFGKFGFSLICSADYKIHKVPSFLKVTSLK